MSPTRRSTPLDESHDSGMNLENAEGWRPEVGEVLTGTVTDIARAWSDHKNGFYPIVTVKSDSGSSKIDEGTEVAVHCFHTVLYNRVVELRPVIGERIGIKYVAATEKGGKGGNNKPAIYNVKIEGRSAEGVWDSMDTDPRFKTKDAQTELTDAVTQEDDIPF